MGRDLLAQDYLLKQLTASLIYPEHELGKNFWERVHQKAYEKFGDVDIPVSTFNKVWIMPGYAKVYESGSTAFITESHLKVMLDSDYVALKENALSKDSNEVSESVVREIVLPEIEKEINQGKNFTKLRQIYQSMIMAAWFKRKLKGGMLSKIYVGANKIAGVDVQDKDVKQKIYDQYLAAFKKGVYNYIREEYDEKAQETVPRKYFSGGIVVGKVLWDRTTLVEVSKEEFGRMASSAITGTLITASAGLKVENGFVSSSPLGTASAQVLLPVLPAADNKILQDLVDESDKVRGNSRALITTKSPDAIDQQLRVKAKAARRKYLRLTLQDESDLSRAMSQTIVHADGNIQRVPGLLPQVIQEGGILFIDYVNSDSKLVESFNSLFDSDPYFRDLSVAASLTVVGAINDEQTLKFPATFYSRYSTKEDMDIPFSDPVVAIAPLSPEEPFDGIVVDLWDMQIDSGDGSDLSALHMLRDALFGRYYLNERGVIQIEEGALVRAAKAEKPLLIRGAPWQDEKFLALLRKTLIAGEVEFNGDNVALPQQIFRQTVDYSQGVENKTIILSDSASQNDQVWVINPETQDALFGIPQITVDGRLAQLPGVLAQQGRIRLMVTTPLEEWVWHRIMHSAAAVEVQVLPGVVVPAAYQSLRSEALQRSIAKPEGKTLDQVKGQQAFVVETNDTEAMLAILENEFPERMVSFPVTSETSYGQVIGDVYIEGGSAEDISQIKFNAVKKEVMRKLRAGETVVLSGNNETLFRKLESAFQHNGYIMENGTRVFLKDLPGRLIIVTNTPTVLAASARQYARQNVSDKEMGEILAREFSGKFNQRDFQRVLKLRDLFAQNIPSPSKDNPYPGNVNFSLSRLRLLYQYLENNQSNWLEAFENVILPSYENVPEVHAYMLVMVRLALGVNAGQQQPKTIHSKKLSALLSNMSPGDWGANWPGKFWQMADAFSIDLLLQMMDGGQTYISSESLRSLMFRMIQEALVKKHTGERQDFYRERFDIPGDVSAAITIDDTLPLMDLTWYEKVNRILRALKRTPGIMLKGWPGTGKSYITEEVAKAMGYKNGEVVGPITVGSDSKQSDVVVEVRTENNQTQVFNQAVAEWAALPHGGLLIVDEANLPSQTDFWNFLEGLFAKKPYIWINGEKKFLTERHRVIFTGNQESLVGRKFMDLIENYMVTVNFKPFSSAFMLERTEKYVASTVTKRDELINLIVDLHFFFQRMNPGLELSLRDLQELSARSNLTLSADWTTADVVKLAWSLYKGNFDAQEQLAFQYLIQEKYGVLIAQHDQSRIKRVKEQRGGRYQQARLSLTDSTADLVADVQDFVRMRETRLADTGSLPLLQGKRGMIIEGPSGRGKDVTVMQELYEHGFREAVIEGDERQIFTHLSPGDGVQTGKPKVDAATPPTRKFYRLTASMDPELVVKAIKKAQAEGSVVIISEMNLLPSGFLEGRLNDVLTGNAHQGFALIGTINSIDYSGREKLSSALLNRVIYKRLGDYSKADLSQIAEDFLKGAKHQDIAVIVNAHLWLREQIANPEHHPTTREFLRAIELWASQQGRMSAVDTVKKVYTLYLTKFAATKTLPSEKDLRSYQRPAQVVKVEMFDMMEHYVNFLVPESLGHVEVMEDPNEGGYWVEGNRAIAVGSDPLINNEWWETLTHEAGHASWTREWPLAPGDLAVIIQDMEDLRQESNQQHFYPHSIVGKMGTNDFLTMIVNGDVVGFIQALERSRSPLTPRQMFQQAIGIYGNKHLTSDQKKAERRAQLSNFADLIEPYFAVNPLRLALNHLDTARAIGEAIATTRDEEDILFQQYRAYKLMKTMRDDFSKLPRDPIEREDLTPPEKAKAMEASAEAMRHVDGPVALESAQQAERLISPEELERKRADLRLIMASRQDATAQRILQQLRIIEEDLGKPEKLLDERLEEIVSLIEDAAYEGSVADLLKQVHPASPAAKQARKLAGWAKQHLAFRQGFAQLPPRAMSRQLFRQLGSLLEKYFSAVMVETSDGYGAPVQQGEQRIGRRSEIIHPERQMAKGHEPVRIKPEPVVAEKVVMTAVEKAGRDPFMQKVTETRTTSLERLIDAFLHYRRTPEQRYGTEGYMVVERALRDMATAFVKTGGVTEKSRKEIVLTGVLAVKSLSPILEEIFQFLFSSGFRVTVYTSATTYVEGIATLGQLKEILGRDPTSVRIDAIKNDLSSRKRSTDYEMISLEELQRKVEAEYAYGAFRLAMLDQNAVPAESQSTKPAAAGQESAAALSKEEQIRKGNAFFATYAIATSDVFKGYPEHLDGYNMDIHHTKRYLEDEDLEDLRGVKLLYLVISSPSHITGGVMKLLHSFPDLREVVLVTDNMTLEEMHAIVEGHPNPGFVLEVRSSRFPQPIGLSKNLLDSMKRDSVTAAHLKEKIKIFFEHYGFGIPNETHIKGDKVRVVFRDVQFPGLSVWESFTNKEAVYSIFKYFPHPENLTIQFKMTANDLSKTFSWTDMPSTAAPIVSASTTPSGVDMNQDLIMPFLPTTPLTKTEEFLQKLVGSLLDRDEVLADVRTRLTSDGLDAEFLKLLTKLNVTLPQGVSASSGVNVQPKNLGGIDMNQKALNLQTEGEGIRFDMPFDPTQLQNIQIDGFSPVILQIFPANLPLFIGTNETQKPLQVSVLN